MDGDVDSHMLRQSCTHTQEGQAKPEWWQVDLQKEYLVKEIIITNRGDCCGELNTSWCGINTNKTNMSCIVFLSFSWQIEKFSCWSWKHPMWRYLWPHKVSIMYVCKISPMESNICGMQLARQICHCVADWAWSVESLWSGSLWR